MVRALTLTLLLAACGSSPPPACPPCPSSSSCDPKVGVCVGFRTPILDAVAPVDAGSD